MHSLGPGPKYETVEWDLNASVKISIGLKSIQMQSWSQKKENDIQYMGTWHKLIRWDPLEHVTEGTIFHENIEISVGIYWGKIFR